MLIVQRISVPLALWRLLVLPSSSAPCWSSTKMSSVSLPPCVAPQELSTAIEARAPRSQAQRSSVAISFRFPDEIINLSPVWVASEMFDPEGTSASPGPIFAAMITGGYQGSRRRLPGHLSGSGPGRALLLDRVAQPEFRHVDEQLGDALVEADQVLKDGMAAQLAAFCVGRYGEMPFDLHHLLLGFALAGAGQNDGLARLHGPARLL